MAKLAINGGQSIHEVESLTDQLINLDSCYLELVDTGYGTIDTKTFETIDNDRESWLLGVLPPS